MQQKMTILKGLVSFKVLFYCCFDMLLNDFRKYNNLIKKDCNTTVKIENKLRKILKLYIFQLGTFFNTFLIFVIQVYIITALGNKL